MNGGIGLVICDFDFGRWSGGLRGPMVKQRVGPDGLTSQLRRCSASIPANLAEGCGRSGDAEFARFCSIAMGSASELEYHLLLAKDLNLIKPKDHAELSQRATELKRMLTALHQKLTADR